MISRTLTAFNIFKRISLVAVLLALALTPSVRATANDGHEYAPMVKQKIKYKDWTLPTLVGDKQVNLREFAHGKKLVLVTYFAPWCPNWRMQQPVINRLYDKYHDAGFDLVVVNEYGTRDEANNFFDNHGGAKYPVVIESELRTDRDKTVHNELRKKTGDARGWGSPYSVFLVGAKLKDKGDVLSENIWTVNGELMETEVEAFIRKQLGLPAETSAPTTAQPATTTTPATATRP